MKSKLSRIWSFRRRKVISLLITLLLFISKHLGRRAHTHWVGYHNRPRRFERPFIYLLVIGGMLLLEPHEYVMWSVMWGGWLALFLSAYSIYRMIPRKRYHWIED